MVISSQEDFGEGLHSSHSEPYYYEAAYKYEHSLSFLMSLVCAGHLLKALTMHSTVLKRGGNETKNVNTFLPLTSLQY